MKDIVEVLEKIREYCENKPEIVAAYFYGSYAEGRAVPSSDLDIGILVEPSFNLNVNYSIALYDELAALSDDPKVEAFVINDKGPLLKYKVISPRRIIFCRDHSFRADFEVRVMNQYFEYRPFYEAKFEAAVAASRERLYDQNR